LFSNTNGVREERHKEGEMESSQRRRPHRGEKENRREK
jgi:hypothetical protein